MTTFATRILRLSMTAVLTCALVTATTAVTATAGDTTPRLSLTFSVGPSGRTVTTVPNSGGAGTGLVATVVTNSASGAKATIAAGRSGQGTALQLPAYSSSGSDATSPFAAVRVQDASIANNDLLDPATHSFSFGADFALNAGETGPASSKSDDGNNLIQRGLMPAAGSTTDTQYKIQVDHRVPSCMLTGVSGGVQKRITLNITADRSFPGTVGTNWYHAICARTSATSATFTLTSYSGSGSTTYSTSAALPSNFDLSTANRSTPLSVGGKLTPSGSPVSGSRDQFNGLVDNATLQIY